MITMINETWTLILLLAVVFGALVSIAAFSNRGSLDSIKSKDVGDGQHGTARWATPAEVRKTFRSIPFQPALWRKGTERKVFLTSAGVAQRAVPCWPSPTSLLLMLSRLPRLEKAAMAARAPNTAANRRISVQVSLLTCISPSFWSFSVFDLSSSVTFFGGPG